ncbi:MAG TPA: hypothetical protein VMP67_00165 [Candidatus Limnocylindria bacterium]|nr:hypothetical protein [Candidatus Limnocylindria bacterium]
MRLAEAGTAWRETAESPAPAAGRHGVAVLDDVPCYRRGLARTLAEAGYRVTEWESAARAGRWPLVDAALLSLAAEQDWRAMRRLVDAGVSVVVLLRDLRAEVCRRALAEGALTVLDWRASPDDIVAALQAALAGRSLIAPPVMRAVLAPSTADEGALLTEQEHGWLRALADGATVAGLAQAAHYSEREMYRRLRSVYRRLGVEGRAAAIAAAVRQGIV